MANEKLIIGAGMKFGFWGLLDTTGRVLGQSSSLTAGDQDGSAMGRLHGVKNFPTGIPDPDIVNVTGDDDFMTSFTFASAEGPSGVLEMATQDMVFEAACIGLEILDQEDFSFLALGAPKDPTYADLAFIFQRQAKSWTSGTRGSARYEGIIITKANCQPLFNDFAERTANPYRYSISMSKSDMPPYGETFGTSVWGTEEMAFFKFTADNPTVLQTWRGNGAQDVFNFAHRPVSAVKCSVYVEGIKQTITTHYTIDVNAGTLGTIDFVTAPANNQLVHVLYEFTP